MKLGTNFTLPAKDADDSAWTAAEASLAQAAAVFPGGMLRFDGANHERRWSPFDAPDDRLLTRAKRGADLTRKHGMTPLLVLAPCPWPTSPWFPAYDQPPSWGAFATPERKAYADAQFAADLKLWRQAIGDGGRIQLWNEPGATHPGGDPTLPRGVWRSGMDLAGADVMPAVSFLGEPCEGAELASAAPYVSGKIPLALHHRCYRPDLGGDAYAAAWIDALRSSVLKVCGALDPGRLLPDPRRIVVTESYVFQGDCAGDRPAALAAIVARLRSHPDELDVALYGWNAPAEGGDPQWGDAERSVLTALASGQV